MFIVKNMFIDDKKHGGTLAKTIFDLGELRKTNNISALEKIKKGEKELKYIEYIKNLDSTISYLQNLLFEADNPVFQEYIEEIRQDSEKIVEILDLFVATYLDSGVEAPSVEN